MTYRTVRLIERHDGARVQIWEGLAEIAMTKEREGAVPSIAHVVPIDPLVLTGAPVDLTRLFWEIV